MPTWSAEKRARALAAGFTPAQIQAYEQSFVAQPPAELQTPAEQYQQVGQEYGGWPGANTFDIGTGAMLAGLRGNPLGLPQGYGAPDTAAAAFGRQSIPAAVSLLLGPGALTQIAGQGALSAGAEALQGGATLESIRNQGLTGSAGAGAGVIGGNILGRVLNAVTGAARGVGQRLALESGIRQTVGSATGSKAIQQAEAGLARNPITSGPYNTIEEANQGLLRGLLNKFLGVAEDAPIEQAMTTAYEQSTAAIRAAVPDSTVIPMSEELARKIKVINESAEGFDLPAGQVAITGKVFKETRSDLTAALKSAKAGVRRTARAAIDLMDGAASTVPTVDQKLYAAGRHQYRAWKTAAAGRAISGDFKELNAPTLLKNLQKSYGEGAVMGGQSTGFPEVDAMIAASRDMLRVKNPVPNSGSPTGLWLAALAADIGTTGGLTTAAGYLGSKAAQTGSGAGAITGLMRKAPAAVKAGATAGAAAGREAGARSRRK